MQDTNIPQNRVIIIGGDHHNGLGLARIFGLNGKKITAIIISSKKHSWIATSKYIENYRIFNDEKEAFDYIRETYSDERLKPVLIPYSDGAALELDNRLNQFQEKFYVPSINGEQGKIASMMDKDAQYKWAQKHELKMAQSDVIDFSLDDIKNFSFSWYPCIVKPNNCAESIKKDIQICENSSELMAVIAQYREKGYSKAIVQEYLNIDYEIDVLGGINKNGATSVFPHRIIRRWPEKKGTSSFTQVDLDENLIVYINNLLNMLRQDGYTGLYDVEIFKTHNGFVLNEINFRNSGSGFRTISQKFYYAYWWFTNIINPSFEYFRYPQKKSFSMTEYTDVRYVLNAKISLLEWVRNLRECSDFALFHKNDLKPFIAKFLFAFIR